MKTLDQSRCQESIGELCGKADRFQGEVYKWTSGAAVSVLAMAASGFGLAVAEDLAPSKPSNEVFVSVELDVSEHPGDLRDAAASLERETGFAADARFPPRFTGEKGERVELWGWLQNSKLGGALGGAVRRVEINRPPKTAAFDGVPSPNRMPAGHTETAFSPVKSPTPGFFREHLGQLLLIAFLIVMGLAILRSPKRIARITRRLFPKK